MKNQCSQAFLKRLAAFAEADLPLYEEDNQRLVQLLKKSGFQFTTEASPRTPDRNVLKQLVILLQDYEIGEAIIIEEIRSKLGVSTNNLHRWLGFLCNERFSVQIKKVNECYYRIA